MHAYPWMPWNIDADNAIRSIWSIRIGMMAMRRDLILDIVSSIMDVFECRVGINIVICSPCTNDLAISADQRKLMGIPIKNQFRHVPYPLLLL